MIVNIYLLYRTNIHRTPLLCFERFGFNHAQSKRLKELRSLNKTVYYARRISQKNSANCNQKGCSLIVDNLLIIPRQTQKCHHEFVRISYSGDRFCPSITDFYESQQSFKNLTEYIAMTWYKDVDFITNLFSVLRYLTVFLIH